MLYKLIITDTDMCYEGYSEDFTIGVFRSEQEAAGIAGYYLKNIEGFRNHNCTYRILEKQVAGNYENKVWLAQGWNENENGDETDIVESKFFGSEKQAETELINMKGLFKRTEWSVNCYRVGEKLWKEGFARV